MEKSDKIIYTGNAAQKRIAREVKGEYVSLLGEQFYKIENYDAMEPFFMSIVSSSDHWLFISSTGGLSAGRVSAEQSLFPYYTVDKLSENNENTGNKAILLIRRLGWAEENSWFLWEPFSIRQNGQYHVQRNLYKNLSNTTVVFEEINQDLGLIYRYAWRLSDRFGFVKTSWLINQAASDCEVELLDGLQNLLPANVSSATQNVFSVLLDAYKRCELVPGTSLGIIALSSILSDLPEPSESLLATTVAQVSATEGGWEQVEFLLSSQQLDAFRRGEEITPEVEVRGRRAAYFLHARLAFTADAAADCLDGQIGQHSWHLVADVCQDHSAVVRLLKLLKKDTADLYQEIEADITANRAIIMKIVAGADGIQLSQLPVSANRHFANVLYNVLRGGTFADQYWIDRADLQDYVAVHLPALLAAQAGFFAALPDRIRVHDLWVQVETSNSADLKRLCATYLPLTFSRRHGDPSRPWNRFTINVRKPDGSQKLDYEGNWRDIFQNWEALAWSYPEFVESMICTFLNATTVDGYNPYRIKRSGVDWEHPEPDNPWANIGYWSDHQIIYLQKLMEISANVHPGKLQQFLALPIFSYANVPYRLKPYPALLQDPHNTIDFDWELQRTIDARVDQSGTDAMLVSDPAGQVFHASLTEKLLTLLLAKLANFVPEGGIWMNTQRPEWNDANNALVGKGLSVVTLCYLRRFLVFCQGLFASAEDQVLPVSQEVAVFYTQVRRILERFQPILEDHFDDEQRRLVMDALGQAGSDYRWHFYQSGISGTHSHLSAQEIAGFLKLVLAYVDHSLIANRRPDHLYHSYNILHLRDERSDHKEAAISHLYEMLEGQTAILSSGLLSPQEACSLLESLRASSLYRADQHSYILYPDRYLPGFLSKNCLPPERVQGLRLVQALVAAHDPSLFRCDLDGIYHFSGHIRNIKDVDLALATLQAMPAYADLVASEGDLIRQLFEETFNHNQFTGRSGTFFAYEGLGSIYWHMVSKLLLAVQENVLLASREPSNASLRQSLAKKYEDIRLGLGFCKSPSTFGAFPTDPYSHTPKGQGAKQPGMTGQVKEDVLSRLTELGVVLQEGQIAFNLAMFDRAELLAEPATFTWFDVNGHFQSLTLEASSLAYTFCQVPILLQASDYQRIEVHRSDGSTETITGLAIDKTTSSHLFQRDGLIHHIRVYFNP